MKTTMFVAAILLGLASAEAVAQAQWKTCAREGEMCTFDGKKLVAYGSGSRWNTKAVTKGVRCSNEAFGDPAPGVVKTCRVRDLTAASATVPSTWARCARESETCKFTGEREVAYGANKRYKYRVFRNSAPCNNDAFGGDPAPGVKKACFYDAS